MRELADQSRAVCLTDQIPFEDITFIRAIRKLDSKHSLLIMLARMFRLVKLKPLMHLLRQLGPVV